MRKVFVSILATLCLLALAAPALASAGPDSRSADPATCAHHFEVSVVREATCAQKGLLAYTCAKCGLTYTAETLPDENAHDYQLTSCTATCTVDGENVYTCTVCGASYTEPAPATGHVPGPEPEDCSQALLCAVCGETLQPPAGHDYAYQYDAQFDENGALTDYGTWQCARCGNVLKATRGNAEYYYGLAPEAVTAMAEDEGSGTDLVPAGSEYQDDDSATDADAAVSEAEQDAAGEEPEVDRRTGLWLTISAVVLCVVIVEAVVLTSSLKKDKTTL